MDHGQDGCAAVTVECLTSLEVHCHGCHMVCLVIGVYSVSGGMAMVMGWFGL